MKLEDIDYFLLKKNQQPAVYELAQRTVDESRKDSADTVEIERRLQLLTRSSGTEHIRQCSNFLAEAMAFNALLDASHVPHWVPETTYSTPDLCYRSSSDAVAVEVKHLNSPREEHEALASGHTYGRSVDMNYDAGLQQKIEDFVASARRKFKKFNEIENDRSSDESGELYLYFSRSLDASLTDGISWMRTMKQRVTGIATPLCGTDITLIVTDIDEQFNS
ncbi:MAG TPA: hypothetical protein VHA52_11580 [Candidatus Babeliaceae bacterium]|nr:hypothetical protein [Candidatus Babeliaceae bacterium]